ncbi:phosphohistidine phosphatase [Cribrihabitans marinus]|uniref:Phosphohistidine phosphatase n=1 Tax=Cribrihabitans marinus TaxID=1227549 RepID=A0A1H7DVQ5_9RHOB|nr:histidine phosphatase family protein [Cribrihabitans marinus]GGH40638.1 phosphoglycerate mutase [Cribrihabitans marinus]SEK05821.1 phosphohistidine phosphatase [Cribrihabitans marinus]
MTRTLILTRHAKSSWDTPGQPDHERPLNKRGRASAEAIGRWLDAKGLRPDLVLCSAAVRTRETWDRMKLEAGEERFTDLLYHVTANQMLRALNAAQGRTVLMLGHNPGLADFAASLVAEPPEHARFEDYPTGATLVLDFDTDDWKRVAWHMGQVREFVLPRELLED